MVVCGLLIAILYFALMTPSVQTKVVKYFTRQLERKTGTEITIGKVNFRPIESLILEDVLVKDCSKDTLLFCKRLMTKVDSFSFAKQRFTITELIFDEAFFNVWIKRDSNGGMTNVEMLFESMLTKTDTVSASDWSWDVDLSKIVLKDSRFNYVEDEYEPLEYGINWTDIACRELNVTISDIDFSGEKYKASVSNLSLMEKSGFQLTDLSAFVTIRNDQLLITGGTIRTRQSEVHLDTLQFDWEPGKEYWHYFTTRMKQRYVFSSSKMHFGDLAYFNETLLGMDNTVTASGVVSNTISCLEGHDLEIHLGEKSVVYGEFRSKGLPHFFDADFEIDFTKSKIVPGELEAIYMPWLESHYVKLPEILHKYQVLSMNGRFRGKIDDFVLEVQSETPGLRGNVEFAFSPDSVVGYRYGGKVKAYGVNYGFLTGQSFLGRGSFRGTFNGSFQDEATIFRLESEVERMRVYDGWLRNIGIVLDWKDNQMDLYSSVENDSLQAGLVVHYTLGDTLQQAHAQGYAKVRSWDTLGPELFGKRESLAFRFAGELEQSAEDQEVNVDIFDFFYENERGGFQVDSLHVRRLLLGDYGLTTLKSEVADVEVEGSYKSLQWEGFKNALLQRYAPAYKYVENNSLPEGTNFSGKGILKKVDTLLPVLYPGMIISNGTRFAWNFNDCDKKINLMFEADSVRWGNLWLRETRVHAEGDSSKLTCVYTADELYYKRVGRLYNVRNTMSVITNRVDNEFTWCNWEKETYCGLLSASVHLMNYQDRHLMQVFVHPGIIVMADSVWNVDRALILKEEEEIYVNRFRIHRNDQFFGLKGRVGKNPRDTLSVTMNNFDLAEFNKILFDNKLKLFGKVNGVINVSDFYKDRLMYADVEVKQWGVDKDTLGTMEFHTYWDALSKMLQIQIEDRIEDRIPLLVAGYYKPSSDSLDVVLNLSGIDMKYVPHYFPDMIKEGKGTVSGALSMKGTMGNAVVDGYVGLDSVSVTFTGLNTAFALNDSLKVKNNRVLFDRFVVLDAVSRPATCSGYYDLTTQLYDINLNFNNFMVLNTESEQGEAFYGQLYISGLTQIQNISGRHSLNLNLKTENNSKLYIPLSASGTENNEQFLHFINNRQLETPSRKWENKSPLSVGVDLNANLEINDNLEVQIIFDPTIGDILRTIGRGDLKVSLDKDNQLQLFGEYKIERGDYLFTLSNLVNKKFVLNSGGSIKWNGSPYDATIDLSAIYHLKTSLNDLLTSSNGAIDKTSKVPVECMLNLSESLMNPIVKFDINFPSLDVQMKSLMQSLFASQDDINKQMFSLLILNKFYTPDYMEKLEENKEERSAGYQAGVTTASELLSNQLSRWLSQISKNFDIGFSYRPGDQVTTNEFELALSTQMFNNRVTLSANGNIMEKAKTNSNTSITGDFDVDVKINKQGTLRWKAYSHTNEKITYNATETVQGVGISYQETFDTIRDLFRKYFGFFKRKKRQKITQILDNKEIE